MKVMIKKKGLREALSAMSKVVPTKPKCVLLAEQNSASLRTETPFFSRGEPTLN